MLASYVASRKPRGCDVSAFYLEHNVTCYALGSFSY